MIQIKDSVDFADKFENYLAENHLGQFSYEQRVYVGRALMNFIDELDDNTR